MKTTKNSIPFITWSELKVYTNDYYFCVTKFKEFFAQNKHKIKT